MLINKADMTENSSAAKRHRELYEIAPVRRKQSLPEPAMDAGELVGIIFTGALVEAFYRTWRVDTEGAARIDMLCEADGFDLAAALKIIAQAGGQVLGVGTFRERWNDTLVWYVRLRSNDPQRVAEVLKAKGYNALGVHVGPEQPLED
jgi:hypothetical protein